ncbi:MAG: hypothetical protein FIB04_12580 [Gammaproteobacteria bacterium]|nr:hypothetical protein [Gammaproteobacteria bacterium]
MRPRNEPKDDEQFLPTDGLHVEETDDEDTVRLFLRAWRRRVSEEYARSILEGRTDGKRRLPAH